MNKVLFFIIIIIIIIIIIMRMRPRLYREKFSRGHPPSPSQLKQMFIWETVDFFTRAETPLAHALILSPWPS